MTTSIELVLATARPISRNENITVCGIPGCGAPHRTANLCVKHYSQLCRWRKKNNQPRIRQDFSAAVAAARPAHTDDEPPTGCLVDGCGKKLQARGLCRKHYNQLLRAQGATW